MFGFFEKKVALPTDNAYSVLNKELERLHTLFTYAYKNGQSKDNLNIYWSRIKELQEALFLALEKQPAHSQDIKDLQDTVAEILLLTDTDSK